MLSSRQLVVIGKVWPEPESSAAGRRILQLIQCFQNEGWRVTFASSANHSEFEFNLNAIGVETASIKLNDSSFDQWIRNKEPDVVLFDRFMTEEQFGWRVAEQCPNALRVLDTEDLHCLRAARLEALNAKRAFEEADLFNETAVREIGSILRCDLSLIISEVELDLLQDVFRVDSSLLMYLPFLLDIQSVNESEWMCFEDRSHFVSIGNFLHAPNKDAVIYLKESLWPEIRNKLPDAELYVYGAYASQQDLLLHEPAIGFHVKGRASQVEQVMNRAKVLLAPLRFGAGLKGKLLDAMLNGTPSVTSSIGSEGMTADNEWPGVVADDERSFVEAAVRLYKDRQEWENCQRKIKNLLASRFNRAQFEKPLMARVRELRSRLETHRQKNFLGSMLMHHTTASSRYMSKWIEEKQKRLPKEP